MARESEEGRARVAWMSGEKTARYEVRAKPLGLRATESCDGVRLLAHFPSL